MKLQITFLIAALLTCLSLNAQQHALPTEWDISIEGPTLDTFPNAVYAIGTNPYITTADLIISTSVSDSLKQSLTVLDKDGFLVISGAFKDSVSPKNCWGQTYPLSIEEKEAFRLYPSVQKQKWYDVSTYKFKGGGKRIVWGLYFVAGVLHGGREAYHAQPNVFEKRFNVSPTSFFGSEQWKRNYYQNNVEQGHKPNVGNTFRDYYHFSSTVHTTFLVGGAVTIGASKQPIKYKILDTLIAITIRSAAASVTYNLLR